MLLSASGRAELIFVRRKRSSRCSKTVRTPSRSDALAVLSQTSSHGGRCSTLLDEPGKTVEVKRPARPAEMGGTLTHESEDRDSS